MTYEDAHNLQLCSNCDALAHHNIIPTISGPHYGRLQCVDCYAFFPGWIGTPGKRKRRRHAQRSLVTRYSKGWCELCQRWGSVLPGPEVLEAHHVTAVEDSGNDTRSNVWILCTPCHLLVHHLRTYLGHYHPTASARLEEGA